jgi:hypothetical protein
MDEGILKRARRQQQHQTRHDKLLTTVSQVWHAVPGVTGKILDYTKRRTRRLQRRLADLLLLDDDTGVRDVISYQRAPDTTNIVVVPDTTVEVISSDSSSGTSSTNFIYRSANGAVEGSLDEHLYTPSLDGATFRSRRQVDNGHFTEQDTIQITHNPNNSQIRKSSPSPLKTTRNDMILQLPHAVNSHVESLPSSTSSTCVQPHRTYQKTIYNPYGVAGWENDDKDTIDRVSEFLIDAADRIMWGMFDRMDDTTNTITEPSSKTGGASSSRSSQSQQPKKDRRTRINHHAQQRNIKKRHKHWKDRLEERLDSMLGLHENGDFYRSWTERYKQEKIEESGNDAFSVAQGRKAKRRSRPNPVYSKPFWEEEGSIFSLLFGRTQQFTAPRIDYRNELENGSTLSILRFVLQYFLVFASYLCRWASTQGAIPQPVVVLGVGSSMLCARPHRRLFTAGITLLLIRTFGEVLHGYVYGSGGWENDNTDTDIDNTDADIGHFDDDSVAQ